MKHWAIFVDNNSNKSEFIRDLMNGSLGTPFSSLKIHEAALFSKRTIARLIDEEEKHGIKTVAKERFQPLKSMSSGEQKKALLEHLMNGHADYIVLDNPFDNLDVASQKELTVLLIQRSNRTSFVQIISRKKDLLPFISDCYFLRNSSLEAIENPDQFLDSTQKDIFKGNIPKPLKPINYEHEVLIELRNVDVDFSGNRVLNSIDWTIKRGQLWQLMGKNGSGKTTLLSMITGENPKGYGQELFLFGKKKGSGESIWDIKKQIGYFTPSMTDKFNGYHTVENMLISGLNDSIGLYIKPTEAQIRLAKEWLVLIHMWHIKAKQFFELSMGQQRLIMTVRAMLKHPLLLILDEPTAGLDDASAALLVSLVNKISRESETTTIFVSHRDEPHLEPDFVYELQMTEKGSRGSVK